MPYIYVEQHKSKNTMKNCYRIDLGMCLSFDATNKYVAVKYPSFDTMMKEVRDTMALSSELRLVPNTEFTLNGESVRGYIVRTYMSDEEGTEDIALTMFVVSSQDIVPYPMTPEGIEAEKRREERRRRGALHK